MADTKQLTEMMRKLGWGTGFRLPIANDENRRLEALLDAKQSRMIAISSELQETSLAVDNTTSFLKHLESKIKHCKDLETAKRSQIEQEKQFLTLTEREKTRTEQDIRKLDKRLKELQDRNRILVGNVVKRKDSLAEFVDVINFDKQAITAYEEKFGKEDAYINFINDVAETDNEKAKKCQEEYRRLGEKIEVSKVHLNETISESDILETEFEALTKRFRKAHGERNQSIDNWKRTLVALEARDEEIMHTCYEHNTTALKLKITTGMLEKQDEFYGQIQEQSKAYMRELNLLERRMNRLYEQKRQADMELEEGKDGVSELTAYVIQIDKEIRSVMKQMDKLNDETELWYDKMIKMKEELDDMKAKYDVVSIEHLTSAEQTNQLQEFLDQEEKKADILMKELEKQTAWKSQKDGQITEMREKGNLVDAHGRNLKTCITNLKKKSRITEDELMKNRAEEYRLDHQIMFLLTKLRGLENPESLFPDKEEYLGIQKKLVEMRTKLEDLLKNQTFIRSQIQHCESVTVVAKRALCKEKEENATYEQKVHGLTMQIKRIGKDDEITRETFKDTVVTHSMTQVQLQRMLQSIKTYESKLLTLEQERTTLQAVVKARKKDIENYCTLLTSKKRALQEESQKLRAKIYDISCDAQARKRKYEMVMLQMWKANEESSQDDGQSRSEAYFIIKLAQEREQYKQEGDKWDQRVKEAEKIVEGLQNTLALMVGTNEVFKESLKPATMNTDEGRQLEDLKNKQLEDAHRLKLLRDKRQECQDKVSKLQGKLDDAIAAKKDLEQKFLEKQYELQGLIIDINGQKEKIRRATQQANKLVKELSKLDSLDAELLQNDLRLRVTKEKYEFAVATLEKLLVVHPNLVGETLEFLNERRMHSVRDRIMQKTQSPMPFSTPHGSVSVSSTPQTSASRMDTYRRRKSAAGMSVTDAAITGRSFVIDTSQPGYQKQVTEMRESLRGSTRKSVVFEQITSTPSVQQVIDNITKGVQKKQGNLAVESDMITQHHTSAAHGVEKAHGVSFGDLRKALQDAVAEQKQIDERGEESEEKHESMDKDRPSVGPGAESVIELVDNKAKFNAETDAADEAD